MTSPTLAPGSLLLDTTPLYEVYALRYATVERQAHENFIASDVHEGPMPMDYFVWLIRGDRRTIVVDTGFNAAAATRRKREFLRCPGTALGALGVDTTAVTEVVITHLHYDHAGNLDLFPNARFYLQDAEMAFSTGRCMCHPVLRHAYDVEDVVAMVRKVYADQVRFVAGEHSLGPGLSLHRIGGHTDGLQVVRVATRRGWLVLASDAMHFYENHTREQPFPIVYNVGDMLEGFRSLRMLADGVVENIVPGHDPAVLNRYPRIDENGVEIARLDLPAGIGG